MIGVLLDAARELAIARTFELDRREDERQGSEAIDAWRRVQHKHLEVNRLTAEGVLYARRKAFRFLWKQTDMLQDLADQSRTFDQPNNLELEQVNKVKKALREAANVLAEDIRGQMGLDPLGSHRRDEQ